MFFPQFTPAELTGAAVDLAYLATRSGDDAGKAALLARVKAVYELAPYLQALANFRDVTGPVEILILDDRPKEALDALEALVDGGWRSHWEWHLESNPIFDAMRREPRFERLIAVLKRDTRRFRQAVAKAADG
jgi:hypothetical protein